MVSAPASTPVERPQGIAAPSGPLTVSTKSKAWRVPLIQVGPTSEASGSQKSHRSAV